MHILVAIVSLLGIIGVILWRLHMATEAAKGLAETASDARGLVRRWRWQRKLARNPLDLIQDPREAAVAMMVAVAQSDGAMTDRERQVIVTELVARIGATERQAEELLAHGRWLTREVHDIDYCFDKLAPLISASARPSNTMTFWKCSIALRAWRAAQGKSKGQRWRGSHGRCETKSA
jgi:hypothetical protein